jgi:gephyrin
LIKKVTTRYRVSPYPLVSFSDALEIIRKETPCLDFVDMSIKSSDILGSTVAANVLSNRDFPEFRASMVDGYAVIGISQKKLTK